MSRVLTNGTLKIGVYQFKDRKRPSLCVDNGKEIVVCGSFHNDEIADFFMDKLAELVGLKGGEGNG